MSDKGCCLTMKDLEELDLCENPKTDINFYLVGENGNVYNLVAIAYKDLLDDGELQYAEELKAGFRKQGSYEEVLEFISTYGKLY